MVSSKTIELMHDLTSLLKVTIFKKNILFKRFMLNCINNNLGRSSSSARKTLACPKTRASIPTDEEKMAPSTSWSKRTGPDPRLSRTLSRALETTICFVGPYTSTISLVNYDSFEEFISNNIH